ncbi:probable disease resistance protein At1g58602 isoform X1 [Triticum urartu]|uniref:probable disease resistance protein At1g58602 isoform X1 n=1 Tax=Triticum urartu TaxID=4572 RepID=UPI002043C2DD|nr:probable disease resistance protein At1g58602 [Triticum urartu]XP_048543933.1 probable disease resistance protein At1g58602 isoform X1 [Triticum urartu]
MAHRWIEKIRVHDILRDWSLEEARQDRFLDVIDKTSGQFGAPLTDIMVSYHSSYQGFSGQNLQARPNLRALTGFRLQSISLPKLRFLRVLHIENSSLQNFSKAIGECIHLRCLMLRKCGHVTTLPSSIGQLLYLQTIDTRGTDIGLVPSSVWGIPSLRHVYLDNYISPPWGVEQKELQTLWLDFPHSRHLYYNLDMLRFLGQMTQLTTMMLGTNRPIPEEMMNILADKPRLVDVVLDGFSELDRWPESHYFPQGLRSFSLTAGAMKQDPMPILEKLPCLVVLKLSGYIGRTMSCSAGGFPRMQNLQLIDFRTEEWKIEAGAMPKLSHLILKRFFMMRKLPEGLLHLQSLNYLELEFMPFISVGHDSTLKELQQKGCKVTSLTLLFSLSLFYLILLCYPRSLQRGIEMFVIFVLFNLLAVLFSIFPSCIVLSGMIFSCVFLQVTKDGDPDLN